MPTHIPCTSGSTLTTVAGTPAVPRHHLEEHLGVRVPIAVGIFTGWQCRLVRQCYYQSSITQWQ